MRISILGSIVLASVMLTTTVSAQKSKKAAPVVAAPTTKVDINKVFKNWKPRNVGPASMSGRVTSIDVEVANPNNIWIGAASGGVWKTNNSGVSWTPVFDEQPILNIGAVAIQQSNPSVVWVGTGEGNPRNSISIGEGIYKTMDAGRTWKRMGLEQTRNIHRVIIDPTNPNTVYAGAIGNLGSSYAGFGLAGCFVARECIPDQWEAFYFWKELVGPKWFKSLYDSNAEKFAKWLKDKPKAKKLVANWMIARINSIIPKN